MTAPVALSHGEARLGFLRSHHECEACTIPGSTRPFTRLLGENYRSTEQAIKELIDNAWDADAEHVWITLPEPLTGDPISLGTTVPE